MTIEEIKHLQESEDKVEFKAAHSQYAYNSSRKSILGYIVALANEGGGMLILGVKENKNNVHTICGSVAWQDIEGKLEEDIYRDKQIRVQTEVVFEDDKRVLIIHVPSRPIGKPLKFEDVPLMRIGEDILPMSDEQLFKILNEQEPDFSASICDEIAITDLDEVAIEKMKEAYAEKQGNSLFLTQSNNQCLSDLGLLHGSKLTYAALVLLGKEDVIRRVIPQSAVFLEFRNDIGQITFDDRQQFYGPYFITIEKLWDAINLRNGKVPVQQGPYIFDIPFFNKEVIREALNNAIAHRSYRMPSEVVIKQYHQALYIISPGGFPIGVNIRNLITVNSTPRNRLLTDVLAKTGIVERSGQGIDKIFFQSIAEAKGVPDYSHTDDFQVELRLSAIVKDKAFALFIKKLQKERKDNEKLSVEEILTLDKIREQAGREDLEKEIVEKLFKERLIEKYGKTTNQKLRLSKSYYFFTNKEADYANNIPIDGSYVGMKINQYLHVWKKAKIGKFVELFKEQLTREQVKNIIYKLSDPNSGYLEFSGKGSGREYFLSKKTVDSSKLIQKALEIGLEELRKKGDIKFEDTK